MSYTYRTLAPVWLIVFGLVALSGSGLVAGSWVLLLVMAAFGAPLIFSVFATPRTVGAATPSQGRAWPDTKGQ